MHSYDSAYAPQRPVRRHFMVYTARAQQAFQHQQFFFEQKDKLACLLNTLGQEAKAVSFPTCMDYPELIDAVTQLLKEAQLMSTLTFAQIQQAGIETAPFAEKVQIVETVTADVRAGAMTASKPVSRKRGRRDEEEDKDMSFSSYNACNKRNRYVAADHDMIAEPAFCGRFADRYLQTAWWMQPICD